MTNIYKVAGMTCGHCASRVAQAAQSVDGVEDASVDFDAKTLTVTTTGDPDHAAIAAAVREAGYEVQE